ncbi:hypothetical protein GGR53DRAFT_279615 [Hypoxylon sp. FL1150]|nr:hypothetical protein GGR53DRAFT_279615 [Hypoxylon sp. FL1150]
MRRSRSRAYNEPPIPYLLGAGSIFLGLHCFLNPRQEYLRFGLPLEPAPRLKNRNTPPDVGIVSPLIYLKGIREITYGLTLIILQYNRQMRALTAMLGIISLAGLLDGIVVWKYGGPKLRRKAYGHWFAFVGLAGWSLRRAARYLL